MRFPRLKDCEVPSTALWSAGAVTRGPGTKMYLTIWVAQSKLLPVAAFWNWLAD